MEKLGQLITIIKETLEEEDRVLFGYLFGSAVDRERFHVRDIDIAVYMTKDYDPSVLAFDLKIKLNRRTGLAPDTFDIKVLNGLLEEGDLFGLLFLQSLLESNVLLVDKSWDDRTDFIERYGMKFRECEGLIAEVMA